MKITYLMAEDNLLWFKYNKNIFNKEKGCKNI